MRLVSGGSDFLLHVAVPDTDALRAFVIDRLTERPRSPMSARRQSTSTSAAPRGSRLERATTDRRSGGQVRAKRWPPMTLSRSSFSRSCVPGVAV